jgi:hypothetical protein
LVLQGLPFPRGLRFRSDQSAPASREEQRRPRR